MTKSETVFLKALETALEMGETCVRLFREKKHESALSILENRSRVVDIILHLEAENALTQTPFSSDKINRLLSQISEKDEEIFHLLKEEKLTTQNEIAKTRKNKENFRGYNLNDLK